MIHWPIVGNVYDLLVSYRSGDMWAPKAKQAEVLASETRYFANCTMNNERPVNDCVAGLRAVKLPEAADRSLAHIGTAIRI